MSRENHPQRKESPKRHPQTGNIITYYEGIITEVKKKERSYVPTYQEVGELFNAHRFTVFDIAKRNPELQKALSEARKEAKENIRFAPSKEMAWFLGMITGSGGSVDHSLGFIRFTHPDETLLQVFKDTGSALLTKNDPQIKAREGQKIVNKSINFFSTKHTNALGNFSKPEKTNTIKKRHNWVLDEEYIDQFISGVFDSGSSIWVSPAHRHIEFMTPHEDVAAFYIEMLVKIGLSPDLVREKKSGNIRSVGLRRIKDLQQFANRVNSLSKEKQKKLDEIKKIETKRVTTKAHSAVEVLNEWKRLKKKLNRTPTASDILELRAKGETPYSRSIYIKYFGTNDEGKATFAVAEKFLDELATLDARKAKKRMEHIQILTLKGGIKRYNEEDIIEEWKNVVALAGPNATREELLKLYKEKQIKYHYSVFINYFGKDPEKPTTSLKIAREKLNQYVIEVQQDDEKQIFP